MIGQLMKWLAILQTLKLRQIIDRLMIFELNN